MPENRNPNLPYLFFKCSCDDEKEYDNSQKLREQIVDSMNNLSRKEGLKGDMKKATLDGWCKDSDPSRLPSLPKLAIFCKVMNTPAPVAAMLGSLGYGVIGAEDSALLKWAKAEMAKKKAIREARLALEAIDIAV